MAPDITNLHGRGDVVVNTVSPYNEHQVHLSYATLRDVIRDAHSEGRGGGGVNLNIFRLKVGGRIRAQSIS
ncbi:MAG: hypothetical protein GY820_31305 [Gammaproteobacteria bacterium]|nr:hypothetical protein [Gammaproteobacteria bacterium]